jgi:hypothetical protein
VTLQGARSSVPRSLMDKISRVGPPEATGVADGIVSFVVRLNEPPAEHWIYVFKTITSPTKPDIDPDRVVFDLERGLHPSLDRGGECAGGR